MVIWKYDLEIIPHQKIELPKNFQVLYLDLLDGNPIIYVAHGENEEKKVTLDVITLETGHIYSPTDGDYYYIGSYNIEKDKFMRHVFAKVLE